MKKLIGLFFALYCGLSFAAGGLSGSYLRLEPSTLPTICRQGDLRVYSGLLQICNNSNTWTPLAGTTLPVPVVNGGTGVTTSTGSGSVVLSASPTFTGTAAFSSITASTSVLSPAFNSSSSNISTAGAVRLANSDFIYWRNIGNTGNYGLRPDADGVLQYGGNDLVDVITSQTLSNKTISAASNSIGGLMNVNLSGSAGITNANLASMNTLTLKGNNTGGSAIPSDLTVSQVNTMLGTLSNPMTTGGDTIYGGASGVVTRLANGSANQVLTSAGGTSAPSWALVTNASHATMAAYTLKGNNTGSSATPADLTVPQVQGLLNTNVAKNNTYSVGTTDNIIIVDTTTNGAWTLTLPTAVGVGGKTYTVKKTTSDTNLLTIATTSSQTIDGATTYKGIVIQYDSVTVVSDGANWQITDRFRAPKTLAATSSAYVPGTGTSGTYYSLTGNSVSLPPGTWQLTGSCAFASSGAGYTVVLLVWSTANGANTSPSLDAGQNLTEINLPSSTETYVNSSTVRITVASATSIYLVPRITATTTQNASITTYIYAERVGP